jgi:two-component system sensor histidine kinase/response regulator
MPRTAASSPQQQHSRETNMTNPLEKYTHQLTEPEKVKALKKILVVDDSPTITKMMTRALQLRGYHVDVASNGQEGLKKLQAVHQEYCMVFTDLEMPIMDGSEMVSIFREWEEKQLKCRTFICSMSSNFEKQVMLRDTYATHYNAFVRKPVTKETIDSILSKMLCHGNRIT